MQKNLFESFTLSGGIGLTKQILLDQIPLEVTFWKFLFLLGAAFNANISNILYQWEILLSSIIHQLSASITVMARFGQKFQMSTLLAMDAPSAVQSSAQIFIHNDILFIDISNNA